MQVIVRFLATFREFCPAEARQGTFRVTVAERETVRGLLKRLALPEDVPRIILVNGQHAADDHRLREGDVVSVCPPLVGGR
jgi:molybdopterin converting factor small subunit